MKKLFLILTLVAAMLLSAATALAASPSLRDNANLLSKADKAKVEQTLKKIEKKYNVRLGVVTMKSIGDKVPVLALGKVQHTGFLIKLEVIWLLSLSPGRIATSLDENGRFLQVGEHASTLDADSGILVDSLAGNAFSVGCVDIDDGHIIVIGGMVGKEISLHHIIAAKRQHHQVASGIAAQHLEPVS